MHTDLGDAGAKSFGVDEAMRARFMISSDELCDGMMKVLANTTRADHGGKLVMYSGRIIPW